MQELTTKENLPTTFNQKFADWMGFKTCGDPELEKIMIACGEWMTAFKQKYPARWISLIGNTGTGKTYCAKKMWQYAKQQSDWSQMDYPAFAIYWPAFVQELRAGKAFEMRTEMRKWPVLFLDDIGADRDTTGFASEELNTLLGCRVGKWTILTSNLNMKGISEIDRRIASRLIRDKNICVGVEAVDFSSRENT